MVRSVNLCSDFSRLGEIANELRARRILIARGSTSFDTSGARQLLEGALSDRAERVIYIRAPDSPNVGELDVALDSIGDFGPDIIVGIGGGRVLDFSKVLSAGFASSQECLEYLTAVQRPELSPLPIVAIPTTSGTGSECTSFAVVYHGDTKYSLSHPGLLPIESILVPSLTYQLAAYQTAATAMDALCQSIEAYWARGSSAESDAYSREAIPMILESLPEVLQRGDKEARASLMTAAHLSGRAIDIAKTTAPHALSYRLASMTGIAHGHAVCLTLGRVAVSISELMSPQDARLREKLSFICEQFGVSSIREFRETFEEFVSRAGLETRLRDVGIGSEAELGVLASSVNLQRLRNNPVTFSKSTLLEILRDVL